MTATFYVGDAIEVMGKLPEKSVDLILTSPPFLALRSYLPADHPDKALEGGSQATPGAFIDWLVDVVEACDRVLAPHGSMCIELGDTYAGSGGENNLYTSGYSGYAQGLDTKKPPGQGVQRQSRGWPLAKSLSLIPELFRFTLVYGINPLTGRQTERWRLRNVVRWVRPNPPVGALGDKFRPATSELMVFCKSAKRYFDLDAVREPYAQPWRIGKTEDNGRGAEYPDDVRGTWSNKPNFTRTDKGGVPPLDWWNIPLLEACEHGQLEPHPIPSADDPRLADPVGCLGPVSGEPTRYGPKVKDRSQELSGGQKREKARKEVGLSSGSNMDKGIAWNQAGAPPLDWWNIPPGGFSGAHYAVWPPELLIKPIKAMCPEKVCRVCGEPSRRIVEQQREVNGVVVQGGDWSDSKGWKQDQDPSNGQNTRTLVTTLGWSDCGHNDFRNGVVLDPFVGSGTTLMVATGHGRDAIGIDLDSRNYDLALQRVGPFILERAS